MQLRRRQCATYWSLVRKYSNSWYSLEVRYRQDPFTSYNYNPPKNLSFGDQPNVPDEVAAEYLVMRDSPNALVGIHNMPGIVLKVCEACRQGLWDWGLFGFWYWNKKY